jgi:acetoacetyl-CoA synthetase
LFSRGPFGPLDRVKTDKEDSKIALTSLREGGTDKVQVTWGEFRQRVGRTSQALRKCGVKEGDRVAGIVSNSLDAIVLFMATITIGAIYTTTAPDMGTQGILHRMVQIEPTYIFMDDAAVYNMKTIDLRVKIKEIIEGMKHVKGFQGVVTFARFKEYADISGIPRW